MDSTQGNGHPQQRIDFGSIPEALQELNQWVLWKTVTRDGKATKMPLSVFGKAASSTNPADWTSYDNAVSHFDESLHSGIGFVFTASDQFCGIDLDGCRDPETGCVADWADDEVLRFSSYTEVSPSQTGLKIWITSDSQLPKGRKKELRVPEIVAKTPAIEAYTQGRYFATTGQVYKNYRHVEHRETELQAFLLQHWPAAQSINEPPHEWRSDDAVVERARKYVSRIPGAVSGESGHNTTFSVACTLVKGFALSESQAFDVLKEWNATCTPPWSEHELQHKIDSAAKAGGETGYLRNAKPERWNEIHSPDVVGVGGLNAGKQRATADSVDDFQPFPVSELPEPLSRFCKEVADAVGCDASFPALVALSVCSAAVGTSRQVCIKRGWFAPGIIWTLLVGESGTQKSPPFRLAMAPMKQRQQRDAEAFMAENVSYQADMKAYKRESKQWERKQEGDEPEQPVRPMRKRCIVQDATIEALAPILNENPRGVLLARDELSGWLAGFDRYSSKSAASSEVPKWLEIYNCESITIDRKTGDERFLFVRRPSVSIAGGIQPGILSRVLTNEHKDNGLQSRLLMTYPPRTSKQWRDDEVSSATQAAYADLIRDLFELQPETNCDESRPATLTLNADAKQLYKAYVNSTGAEQSAMHGHLASQWSKLEETPARLAIILHCVRQVTSGVADPWQIDELTMNSAIVLAEWFKDEALRIGRLLSEPDETRKTRHLASWIRSHGGTITARDLCKYRRDIATSDDAERLLMALVEDGFGRWRGLHRSREFVLNEPALSADGA